MGGRSPTRGPLAVDGKRIHLDAAMLSQLLAIVKNQDSRMEEDAKKGRGGLRRCVLCGEMCGTERGENRVVGVVASGAACFQWLCLREVGWGGRGRR